MAHAPPSQSVLHLHYDPTYDAALGALLADLTKAGNTGGNQLHAANGLWVQKGFAIQPAFENTLANNYHAPLSPLDFIANPEAARSQINRWTEEHTKEKIKNVLRVLFCWKVDWTLIGRRTARLLGASARCGQLRW